MLHTCIIVSLLCYALGVVGSLLQLAPGKLSSGGGRRRKAVLWLAFFGVLLQSIALVLLLLLEDFAPMRGSGDYYFWLSWLLALLFLLLRRSFDSPPIGALMLGFSTLFLVSSSLLVHEQAHTVAVPSVSLLLLHIGPALIAESMLVLALVASLGFLYKERLLRTRASETLLAGQSSLDWLHTASARFVVLGFVAMTVAVLSGIVWALQAGASLLSNDPRQWGAFLAWIMLAALLHGYRSQRWSRRRIARGTVVLAGIVIVLFIISMYSSGSFSHGS